MEKNKLENKRDNYLEKKTLHCFTVYACENSG